MVSASSPTVVVHGDDVDPLISFADLVAFMTDVKLYCADKNHRILKPENIEYVWRDVFDVEVRFIDRNALHKIT